MLLLFVLFVESKTVTWEVEEEVEGGSGRGGGGHGALDSGKIVPSVRLHSRHQCLVDTG